MVDSLSLIGRLLHEIDDATQRRKDQVVSGSLPGYEEYLKLTGEISGLTTARNILIDFQGRLEQD